ncbi:MAG TPA: hypothetical protein VLL52_11415 [Anaerolineae bacterium]|nr:hypothetical protein [Anaerolineae bacterium]
MKPLVFWCRWQEAKLQIAGRDKENGEKVVWGNLAFAERDVAFKYWYGQQKLRLEEAAGERVVILDEMGVEVG